MPAVVGEPDVADVHRRWGVRRRALPARFVPTADRNGEHADHTGERGEPTLHLVGHEQDLADRLEQAEDEEDAGGGLADGDLAGADQPVADRQQADEPGELRRGESGEQPVEDDAYEQAVPHDGPRGGGDAVEVSLGLAEGDHGPGAAERPDHLVGTMSPDGHRLVEQRRGDAQVRPHREHLDRDGDGEAEQEARVDHGQADGGDPDREDGRRERGQDRRHRVRHVVDVVAGPGEQIAGAGPFDDRRRQPQGALDQPLAEAGDQAVEDPRRQDDAHPVEDRLHHGCRHDRGGDHHEVRRRASLLHGIDDSPEGDRHDETGRRGADHHQRDQRRREPLPAHDPSELAEHLRTGGGR